MQKSRKPVLAKAPTLYVLTKKSDPQGLSYSIRSTQYVMGACRNLTLVFSSDSRFFECERLCDRDACCTGFGFLNVSQLQGEDDKRGSPHPLAYYISVETHL